jgi:hypothetical protein
MSSGRTAKIISSLISSKSQKIFERSFHSSALPRSLLSATGSVVIAAGVGFSYCLRHPYVNMYDEKAMNGKALGLGISAGLASYVLFYSNNKSWEQRKFGSTLTKALFDLGYDEEKEDAIREILVFHHINMENFKKDHSESPREWSQDIVRMWVVEKINILYETITNSTQEQFNPRLRSEKNSLIEALSVLYPEIKKDNIGEKKYKQLMVAFVEEINQKNGVFLEKYNGVKPRL